jgi:AcrR family transcriptional regulator
VIRRRTGRRPGNNDTRAEILVSARELFAERGYDGASVRQIATRAGVDPALVHHYFGTKESLFRATIDSPIDPAEVFPRIWAGGVDGLGERIARTFLGIWDDPATGPAIRATMRSAVTSDLSSRLLREFFATQVVRRIIRELDLDETDEQKALRASFVASQLFGVALGRYILRFEPLASVPTDTVVAAIGPTIQRYLTADLGGGTSASLVEVFDKSRESGARQQLNE